MNNRQESTYALLVRSEEKSRTALETVAYLTFILSVVVAVWQFAQHPVNMGYLSVKTMVEHLQGKPVPPGVDTGVILVTADNVGEASVQAVINPPDAR